VERARDEIAPYLQKRIRELADHRLVGEVRGVGMLGAIELAAHKGSRTFFRDRGAVGLVCRDHCFKNGLIMRAVRDTMIMAPPLVMTENVDELIEKGLPGPDGPDIGVGRRGMSACFDSGPLPGWRAAACSGNETRPRQAAGKEKTVNVLLVRLHRRDDADFEEKTGIRSPRCLRFEQVLETKLLSAGRADVVMPTAGSLSESRQGVPEVRQVAEPHEHGPGHQRHRARQATTTDLYLWGTIGLGYRWSKSARHGR
jgi:hypothetical protein